MLFSSSLIWLISSIVGLICVLSLIAFLAMVAWDSRGARGHNRRRVGRDLDSASDDVA
jgi:hypothetical protein